MKALGLFLLAVVLVCILIPMAFFISLITSLFVQDPDGFLTRCAVALDMAANVFGGYFWNFMFLQKGAIFRFGRHETMSSVFGKNIEPDGHLNWHGRFWAEKVLGKTHCIKSIDWNN